MAGNPAHRGLDLLEWPPYARSVCFRPEADTGEVPSKGIHMGMHQAPSVLRRWTRDVPGGDLHELTILSSEQVCVASGRYAHSSGSVFCTWVEFADGTLNALATERLGKEIVDDALAYISRRQAG
jgi:hypothetical protein